MSVPTNSALDAAVAALTSQPYPWFLPTYSIRLSDPVVYQAIVDTYGFGTPVVIGLSPVAAEALTGLTINQDTSYAAQSVVPQIFVHPSAQDVLGTTVSLSDSGGTIFTSYATPFGRSDRVIWEWQCDVQLDAAAPLLAGSYEQAVVQWTGDDASGRLIPTPFALDTGKIAIWICGGVGAGISDVNCFRHNDPGMGGTSIMGAGLPPDATHGIMTFTASGFTVTKGSIAGQGFANALGHKYSAIVLRDTTSDNRYLRIGNYTGVSGLSLAVNVTNVVSGAFTGTGFLPQYGGLTFTDSTQGTGTYIFNYLSPTSGFLSGGFRGTIGGIALTYGAHPLTVITAGKASPLTHLWIWGRGVAYRSTDFTGDASVSLAVEAYPTADVIVSMGNASFIVGTQNNVNTALTPYNYVALSVDAALASAHLFASFKGTGTASPPLVVTGLGLTPGLAFGRQFTTLSAGGIWRGLDHTGTDSAFCAPVAGNDNPSTGIVAMAADTVSFSTDLAPNGVDTYGWAFMTGALVVATQPDPPYDPIAVPPGAYVPNGGLLAPPGLGLGYVTPCGCPGDPGI